MGADICIPESLQTGLNCSLRSFEVSIFFDFDEIVLFGFFPIFQSYQLAISIHAPRAGSDHVPPTIFGAFREFQSTLPVRGATRGGQTGRPDAGNFNPRSPCGERHCPMQRQRPVLHFNPRSPCGERRCYHGFRGIWPYNFNPRSPCGERPNPSLRYRTDLMISIHAPRAGSDSKLQQKQSATIV